MGFEHDLFKKGREAEITVFDPNENWVFNNDDIYSKSKNSPFVDKKSREQFQTKIHKRLIDILNSTPKTVEALMKLDLPAGVDIEIKV